MEECPNNELKKKQSECKYSLENKSLQILQNLYTFVFSYVFITQHVLLGKVHDAC